MKKLFVLFLCLVAVAGFVSAGAVHPSGVPAPEVLPGYGVGYCAVTPDTALVAETYGLPDQILIVSDFTQDIDLICLWSDQYREGLLSRDEFKTLVAGRIAVMYRRDQADKTGGMRALAKKTMEEVDRFFKDKYKFNDY